MVMTSGTFLYREREVLRVINTLRIYEIATTGEIETPPFRNAVG
jgi:hypothetical protein